MFFISEIRGADENGDYPIMLQKLLGKPTTLRYALFEKHSKELDPGQSFSDVPVMETKNQYDICLVKFALRINYYKYSIYIHIYINRFYALAVMTYYRFKPLSNTYLR